MTNTAAPNTHTHNTSAPGTGGRGAGSQGKPPSTAEVQAKAGLDPHQVELLVQGRHHDPHSILGRHGGLVRAFRPAASEMYLLVTGPGSDRPVLERVAMHLIHPAGLWEGDLDRSRARLPARGDLRLGRFTRLRVRRPLSPLAHAGRPGPPPLQRGPPPSAMGGPGRPPPHPRWGGRHGFRSVGAQCQSGPRSRGLELLGRAAAPDAGVGGLGGMGVVHPGRPPGLPLQVRAGHSGRTADFESGPVGFCH